MSAFSRADLEDVSYDTPWVHSLHGRALPPYSEYEDLQKQKIRPSSAVNGDWANASVVSRVSQVPEVEEAMWECVLGLWRLSTFSAEKKGPQWQDYMSAYLASRFGYYKDSGFR